MEKLLVTPNTALVISLRPKQLLIDEELQMLPYEVADAAGEKFLGMPARSIEHVFAIGEVPQASPPLYAVAVQADRAWDFEEFADEVAGHTEFAMLNDVGYLKNTTDNPWMPSFYLLNEKKTLLVAPTAMIEKLIGEETQETENSITEMIANRGLNDDLYVAADLEAIRPFLFIGIGAAASQVPEKFRKYTALPTLLKSLQFSMNYSNDAISGISVVANNETDAENFKKLLRQGAEEFLNAFSQEIDKQHSDDPVERAIVAYLQRVMHVNINNMMPTQDGDSFYWVFPKSGSKATNLMFTATAVSLVTPAVIAARAAARRAQSINNMKHLMIAMHSYHATHNAFPAHANYSQNGKPLLSWRVHLLPFLDEEELYNQFHFDEPWDSPHNKTLINKMPDAFREPASGIPKSEFKTNYLAPVGEGFVFDGTPTAIRIRDITDGTSNTIAMLQVDDDNAVVWTKPDDWEFDNKKPYNGLTGKLYNGTLIVALADGSTRTVKQRIEKNLFEILLKRNDGEFVPLTW
ncbi:DUF1559 family PulG-like putative transporter [Calycomorphotria hydatis]|uniref:DUF1559 family PulG-like putative transporter n=1 Tax=Calycomorphotria hydatis TaxID=2528027 RepID=UPI0018D26062|nr:DUF1559 domain-containing protein [Calycomorphotria hydatis]